MRHVNGYKARRILINNSSQVNNDIKIQKGQEEYLW